LACAGRFENTVQTTLLGGNRFHYALVAALIGPVSSGSSSAAIEAEAARITGAGSRRR
jgi:hypothetical protein